MEPPLQILTSRNLLSRKEMCVQQTLRWGFATLTARSKLDPTQLPQAGILRLTTPQRVYIATLTAARASMPKI